MSQSVSQWPAFWLAILGSLLILWSGRGDLNARPPAPKLDTFPLYHSPVPKAFNNLGRLLSLSRHPFAYQHDQ
jgi:hypothetical protein